MQDAVPLKKICFCFVLSKIITIFAVIWQSINYFKTKKIMKAEENKKNIELNDEQLDDVTGGKNTKRKIDSWSHGHHDLLILAT